MACDASFLKHYHTPVIHFGTLHLKNEETLYYSAGPISRYSHNNAVNTNILLTYQQTLQCSFSMFQGGVHRKFCMSKLLTTGSRQ